MTEETLEFDVETITLGEAIAAEDASGKDFQRLIRTSMGQRVLVVFVQRLRSSGKPPQWHELMNLRLIDASPGRSRSLPDSPSPISNVSD